MDWLTADSHLPPRQIDAEVAHGEGDLRGLAGGLRRVAERDPHPREKFSEPEGLAHIVVRTRVQGLNTPRLETTSPQPPDLGLAQVSSLRGEGLRARGWRE